MQKVYRHWVSIRSLSLYTIIFIGLNSCLTTVETTTEATVDKQMGEPQQVIIENTHATPEDPIISADAIPIVENNLETQEKILPYSPAPLSNTKFFLAEPKIYINSEQILFRPQVSDSIQDTMNSELWQKVHIHLPIPSSSSILESSTLEPVTLESDDIYNTGESITAEDSNNSIIPSPILEEMPIVAPVLASETVTENQFNANNFGKNEELIIYRGQNIPLERQSLRISDEASIELVLNGRGWVFLEGDENLEYRSKESNIDSNVFFFSSSNLNSIEHSPSRLYFQRQNLQAGEIEYRAIDLEILAPAPANTEEVGASITSIESDINTAAAVTTEVYENISSNSEENMLNQENRDDASNNEEILSDQREATPVILTTAELETMAENYFHSGNYEMSLATLVNLRNDNPAYSHNDRITFSIAQMLESPEIRQIQSALAHYNELIKMYPFSPYVEQAEQRVRFIQRNIINVF